MSRFQNLETGIVVSVADEKDDRFTSGWKPAEEPKSSAARAKKSEE